MQESCEKDIISREGFTAAAAPLERLLLTVGYSILHSWDAAADAVQSALLRAWRSRRCIRNVDSFKPWLVKIVINESKNIARRGFMTELSDTAAETPADPVEKIDVQYAVDLLPLKYRLPIILFYYDDMSVADISEVLDKPRGTVISLLHRGREQLRKELKDYGE